MSYSWRRILGAALLIATMGFSSCVALLNVNTDRGDTPIYVSPER